jgi:hypothetical protein
MQQLILGNFNAIWCGCKSPIGIISENDSITGSLMGLSIDNPLAREILLKGKAQYG